MMDVSVVLTSCNTRDLLLACLRSVTADLTSSGVTWEIIVVDDGSTDDTSTAVKKAFPHVRLFRNEQPQGYARANNIGIQAARGDAVLLLNSDTVVHPGAIPAMIAALQRDARIGGVGPMLRNGDGSLQRSCFRFPLTSLIGNSLPLFRLRIWDDYRYWDHRTDRVVDCISSAALLVRRSVFDEVGLLDEKFWVYGIDIDYAMRMRAKGYRLLSLHDASITHYGGASWQKMSERIFADNVRSHERLFRKHYGLAGFALFRTLLLANSVTRLAFWGAVCAVGARRYRHRVDHYRRHLQWALRT